MDSFITLDQLLKMVFVRETTQSLEVNKWVSGRCEGKGKIGDLKVWDGDSWVIGKQLSIQYFSIKQYAIIQFFFSALHSLFHHILLISMICMLILENTHLTFHCSCFSSFSSSFLPEGCSLSEALRSDYSYIFIILLPLLLSFQYNFIFIPILLVSS